MMIARPWLFSTEWEYVCGAGGLIVLVLAQVAILLSRWLRNSPAIRHTVLLSGLAGCLTVSVVALIVSATGVPLLPLSIAVEETTKAGLPVAPNRVAPGVIQDPSPTTTASLTGWPRNSDPVVNPAPEVRDFTAMPASPPTFESPAPAASSVVQFRLSLRLAIAWIAGTCLLAGFAFRSVWQANGIRRRSSNLNTARLNSTAAGAATRVALRQLPEIRQSAEIHAPVVVGFLSPAVLLPQSVGLTVSDDELRDILIHELAHVRRRDQWVVAAQAVARAVLWPVPTIHWLNRELGRAREEVCDNFVLAQRDAIAYSELLLRLARLAVGVRPLELTAGMLNWRGDLEVRIGRLLDKRRSRATSSSNIVKSLFVAAFLLTGSLLCGTRFVSAQQPPKPAPAATAKPKPPEDPQKATKRIASRKSETEGAAEKSKATNPDFTESVRVRVVDHKGNSVANAEIVLWAVAYNRGSTGFEKLFPVVSDQDGLATVPYPPTVKNVRVDRVALMVKHPDFPTWSDYRAVDDATPIQFAQPIRVMVTAVCAADESSLKADLFAITNGTQVQWTQTGEVLQSATLAVSGHSQSQLLRIVHAPEKGPVLFSDLIDLATIPPKNNDIVVAARLHPSGRVEGRIAEDVPRPVKNGRVLATVIHGMGAGAEWNWDVEAPIADDGTFMLEGLPEDEHLQIFALCDGWVSLPPRPSEVDAYATRSGFTLRNNHGFTGGRVMPQLHFVTSGTSEVVIPMHRTGDVEVTVMDWDDKPIAGANVHFSPNQAWYNGSSTLLGIGRGTLPALRLSPDERQTRAKEAHDKLSAAYRAVTDDKGVAIVRNLPAHSGWHKIDGVDREGGQFLGFHVEHPDYLLVPKEPQRIMGPGSVLETVDMLPGKTAAIRVRMERRDAPRSVAAVTPPARPATPPAAAVEKPQAETKAVDSPKEESFPISVSGMAKNGDGNPVAGARIVLIAVNGDHRELAVTKSDAEGRFEFKYVPLTLRPNQRGGTVDVFGTARSYGLAWHGMRHVNRDQRPAAARRDEADVSFYNGEPIEMNLLFPSPTKLNGRVLDEQGEPVGDAQIELGGLDYLETEGRGLHRNYREFQGLSFLPKDIHETKSNADGRFELTGLPRNSVAWVQISHAKFARHSLYAAITDQRIKSYRYINVASVTIRDGKAVHTPIFETREVSTSPLTIQVAKNRQMTVKTVDRDGGPVAAVGVFATSGDGATGTSAHGTTDTAGQVRLALPPGEFKLSARPPRTSDFVVTSDTMTVNEEPDNQDHELRLQDGCVLIVKAIDADSGDPIAGISFWQELDDKPGARSGLQTSTMFVDHPVSDKNGEIRSVVKPGTRKYGVGFSVLPKPYQGIGGGGGREVKCEAGKTIRVTFELRKSTAE